MENEPNTEVKLLSAQEFVHLSLGKLGVKRVIELSPRQHVGIALAFQLLQSDVDAQFRVPQLELGNDREKIKKAKRLLGGRGGVMLSLIEELNGVHSLAEVDETVLICLDEE